MEFEENYYDCPEYQLDEKYFEYADRLDEDWAQDNILASQEMSDFAQDDMWQDYEIGGES